jgi:hypothetical protein
MRSLGGVFAGVSAGALVIPLTRAIEGEKGGMGRGFGEVEVGLRNVWEMLGKCLGNALVTSWKLHAKGSGNR